MRQTTNKFLEKINYWIVIISIKYYFKHQTKLTFFVYVGGKQGRVAVFRLNPPDRLAPGEGSSGALLSFRAHGGTYIRLLEFLF